MRIYTKKFFNICTIRRYGVKLNYKPKQALKVSEKPEVTTLVCQDTEKEIMTSGGFYNIPPHIKVYIEDEEKDKSLIPFFIFLFYLFFSYFFLTTLYHKRHTLFYGCYLEEGETLAKGYDPLFKNRTMKKF